MKINCLSCGFKVDLDDVYDDYEGQVKCFTCGALLEVKTEAGKLQSVKVGWGLARARLKEDATPRKGGASYA